VEKIPVTTCYLDALWQLFDTPQRQTRWKDGLAPAAVGAQIEQARGALSGWGLARGGTAGTPDSGGVCDPGQRPDAAPVGSAVDASHR